MHLSRTTGFVVAGALFAGAGGLISLAPAGAAVAPTTLRAATTPGAAAPASSPGVGPTSPRASAWQSTSFVVSAGQAGTARIAASTADRELIDWSVAPKATTGAWTSAVAVVEHGAHLQGTTTVPWFIAAPPTVATSGQGLVLGTRYRMYQRSGLGWATVSKRGKVSRLTPLTKAGLDDGQAVSLSMNAKGAAVAAWVEGGGEHSTLRAALRRSETAGFGKAFTVSLPGATNVSGVSTAIDAGGHVAVIYGARPAGKRSAFQAIWGATGLATGTSLHNVGVAGPEEGTPRTSASFAAGGRLDIAWGAQLAGEEADGPYVVRAASLGRRSATFGPEQVLDEGGAKAFPAGGPQVVPGPGTSSLVAWTGVGAGGALPVKVAASNPTGQFGDAQILAPNGRLGGVAWSPTGAFVTLAAGTDEPRTMLSASLRLAGGAFGAPGDVVPLPIDDDYYAQPLGSLKPAPVITQSHLLDPARAMLARIVPGADGAPRLVLTQYILA